jgi:hypothetical protein
MFVDRSALLWEMDPDKMTPDQLDCIAEHLLQKVLAGKSQAVADEARRLIEAGETVTVEALYEYAAERASASQDLRGSAAEPSGGREP